MDIGNKNCIDGIEDHHFMCAVIMVITQQYIHSHYHVHVFFVYCCCCCRTIDLCCIFANNTMFQCNQNNSSSKLKHNMINTQNGTCHSMQYKKIQIRTLFVTRIQSAFFIRMNFIFFFETQSLSSWFFLHNYIGISNLKKIFKLKFFQLKIERNFMKNFLGYIILWGLQKYPALVKTNYWVHPVHIHAISA